MPAPDKTNPVWPRYEDRKAAVLRYIKAQQNPRTLGFRRTPSVLDELKEELAFFNITESQRSWIYGEPCQPSLAEVIERVKKPAFRETYAIFRSRDPDQVEGDRLLDCIAMADTLDQACEKLIRLAGYDTLEAEALELDVFNGGNIMELCDRLGKLTGDRYEVSSYETLPEA